VGAFSMFSIIRMVVISAQRNKKTGWWKQQIRPICFILEFTCIFAFVLSYRILLYTHDQEFTESVQVWVACLMANVDRSKCTDRPTTLPPITLLFLLLLFTAGQGIWNFLMFWTQKQNLMLWVGLFTCKGLNGSALNGTASDQSTAGTVSDRTSVGSKPRSSISGGNGNGKPTERASISGGNGSTGAKLTSSNSGTNLLSKQTSGDNKQVQPHSGKDRIIRAGSMFSSPTVTKSTTPGTASAGQPSGTTATGSEKVVDAPHSASGLNQNDKDRTSFSTVNQTRPVPTMLLPTIAAHPKKATGAAQYEKEKDSCSISPFASHSTSDSPKASGNKSEHAEFDPIAKARFIDPVTIEPQSATHSQGTPPQATSTVDSNQDANQTTTGGNHYVGSTTAATLSSSSSSSSIHVGAGVIPNNPSSSSSGAVRFRAPTRNQPVLELSSVQLLQQPQSSGGTSPISPISPISPAPGVHSTAQSQRSMSVSVGKRGKIRFHFPSDVSPNPAPY